MITDKMKFEDAVQMANMENPRDFKLERLDENRIGKTLKDFRNKYIMHNKGFFIMAPSGTGKTYFCKNQSESHWIDGDEIWIAAGAHPDRSWWLESGETMDEIDKRSDVVTFLAKKAGYWIMGASNYWLKPDVIVIPDWEDHKRLIKNREKNNYDGGATSDKLEQVLKHREWIMRWSEKGVPIFKTVQDAVNYLTQLK